MDQVLNATVKKPAPVRAIFILNAVKILISFTLFTLFTVKNISLGNVDKSLILYTSLGYVATFATMVFFILRKQVWGVRAVSVIDLLISLPASAFIGIAVAVISFILTYTRKAKAYFVGE